MTDVFMRVESIMELAAWQQIKDELECISPIVSSLWPIERMDALYGRAKTVQRVCYQHLHMGSWSDVPMVWRDAYQGMCVLVGVILMEKGPYDDAMQELDKGLLLGGDAFRSYIHTLIDSVAHGGEMVPGDVYVLPECQNPGSGWQDKDTWRAIQEVDFSDMALDTFLIDYLSKSIPVVIRGLARDWPACSLWNQKSYWKCTIAAGRTVPVEIGRDYMAADWTQKLMSFTEFLDRMEDTNGECVYLAQHDLFDQIPRLLGDVVIPDFCISSRVQRRIWIGPAETRTPIHQDPYENVFCQIVGYKYMRLYPPRAAPYLQLDTDGMAPNTSTLDIDIHNINDCTYPEILDSMYSECILGPGDAIYIPRGWYHFVKSLTTSFSVSFWWDSHTMD